MAVAVAEAGVVGEACKLFYLLYSASTMNERRADNFENYVPDPSRNTFGELSAPQRTELTDLVVQATQNFPAEDRLRMVQEATGITSLIYGLCMIRLIDDGVLEKNTLKFERTEAISSEG